MYTGITMNLLVGDCHLEDLVCSLYWTFATHEIYTGALRFTAAWSRHVPPCAGIALRQVRYGSMM
jgi:hypothetical protein